MIKAYRPIKTNNITQKFGENKSCCKTNVLKQPIRPFQVITKINNTCPIGYTSFYEAIGLKSHNGTDMQAYRGEPVYFNVQSDPDTKWFARTEVDADGGVGLRVHSLDPLPFTIDEVSRLETTQNTLYYYNNQSGKLHVQFLYWHLKDVYLSGKPQIQIGVFADGSPQMAAEIKFGDLIAFANSTGASSGDHVHHSMKFCAKNTMTIGADNGYAGAVNMDAYFENTFVGDVVVVENKAVQAISVTQNIIAEIIAYIKGRFIK